MPHDDADGDLHVCLTVKVTTLATWTQASTQLPKSVLEGWSLISATCDDGSEVDAIDLQEGDDGDLHVRQPARRGGGTRSW